jgi:hypothetical protein
MLDIARRITVTLVLVAALAPGAASACSCTNELTLEEEFGYAWTVFSGRVLAVQPSVEVNAPPLAIIIQPLERWKGPLGDPQVVYTNLDEATCGYPFEVGQDYLIFTTLTYVGITYSPAHFTHLCAKTSPLAGNVFVPLLPAPQLPTPTRQATWGRLKLHYR